jgi:NAD-dependent deacetylase
MQVQGESDAQHLREGWPGNCPPLHRSTPVAVLTGAGVSAESGVPTFRDEGGLWHSYRAQDLATPQAFRRDPALVWQWYDWRRSIVGACRPNTAHHALADMEQALDDFVLVTQNVDGLHRLAGSRRVLELHGNIWRLRCTLECRPAWEDRRVPLPEIPPRCPGCGALARPDVVWFGEALPGEALMAAMEASRRCALMLVVGTSALVQPAASLPLLALDNGAYLVEINPAAAPLSHLAGEVLREPAAQALPRWWASQQLSHPSG